MSSQFTKSEMTKQSLPLLMNFSYQSGSPYNIISKLTCITHDTCSRLKRTTESHMKAGAAEVTAPMIGLVTL